MLWPTEQVQQETHAYILVDDHTKVAVGDMPFQWNFIMDLEDWQCLMFDWRAPVQNLHYKGICMGVSSQTPMKLKIGLAEQCFKPLNFEAVAKIAQDLGIEADPEGKGQQLSCICKSFPCTHAHMYFHFISMPMPTSFPFIESATNPFTKSATNVLKPNLGLTLCMLLVNVICGILGIESDSGRLLDILELRDVDIPSFDIIHEMADEEGLDCFAGKDDDEEFKKDQAEAAEQKEKMRAYRKYLKIVRERVKAASLANKRKRSGELKTHLSRFESPLSRWKRPPVKAVEAALNLDQDFVRQYLPPPVDNAIYYVRAHDHQKRWEIYCKKHRFYRSYSYGKHGYAAGAKMALQKAWGRFQEQTCLPTLPQDLDLDEVFSKWLESED